MSSDKMLIVLAAVIILGGIYLGVKGKTSMVRERFGSGVSPENERKFMLTIGGGVCIIGMDLLVLALLSLHSPITQEMTLVILGIGLILFVGIILIGQKYFRR